MPRGRPPLQERTAPLDHLAAGGRCHKAYRRLEAVAKHVARRQPNATFDHEVDFELFAPALFLLFAALGRRELRDEAHRQHGDERSAQRRRAPTAEEVCRRRAARAVLVTSNSLKPYQDAVSISKLQLLISPSVAFHPGSVAFAYSRGKHMKPLSSSASLRAASPSPLPSTTALAVT